MARRRRREALTAPADDGELILTLTGGDGWRCPGCGGIFRTFYGSPPRRRCLECWVAENPDDPFSKRLAEAEALASAPELPEVDSLF